MAVRNHVFTQKGFQVTSQIPPTDDLELHIIVVDKQLNIYEGRLGAAELGARCPILAAAPSLLGEFLSGYDPEIAATNTGVHVMYRLRIGRQMIELDLKIDHRAITLEKLADEAEARIQNFRCAFSAGEQRSAAALAASEQRNARAVAQISELAIQLGEARKEAQCARDELRVLLERPAGEPMSPTRKARRLDAREN
jgi:hypothetical protein